MHYIYKITNKVNNKVYIGQTNNPKLRWSQHKSNAKYNRTKQLIARAMKKYGIDVFEFTILTECITQEDVDAREIEFISRYDSLNPLKGYNLERGGNTSPRTKEIKMKISLGRKGIPSTRKGKKLSEEHRKNLSVAAIGKNGTNIGRKFHDEWKTNISMALTGKKASKETIIRLSEGHMGQPAPNRKLTFEIAEQIRLEYATGGLTQKQLAAKYDLSQCSIFYIIKRRTYNK